MVLCCRVKIKVGIIEQHRKIVLTQKAQICSLLGIVIKAYACMPWCVVVDLVVIVDVVVGIIIDAYAYMPWCIVVDVFVDVVVGVVINTYASALSH